MSKLDDRLNGGYGHSLSSTRSSEFRVQAKMLSYAELDGGFNGEVR